MANRSLLSTASIGSDLQIYPSSSDTTPVRCFKLCIFLKLYWKFIFAILWPFIALVVFSVGTDAKIRCLYVELIVYGYCLAGCVPEAITAMIPIFALPMLYVQDTNLTCRLYFMYGFFSVAAFSMAVIVEHSGLHKRIVLYFSMKLGGSPKVVHMVISIVSWSFSFRLSNAYVVNMMLPLISKILQEIDMTPIRKSKANVRFSRISFAQDTTSSSPINLSMSFFCGLIYSTTYGGLSFSSGTATNVIFKAIYQIRFPTCGIDQTHWFCYTIVVSILSFIVTLIWLQILYLGLWRRSSKIEFQLLSDEFKEQKVINNLYKNLGKITWNEKCYAIAFSIYIMFWYLDLMLHLAQIGDRHIFMFIGDTTPFLLVTFTFMVLPVYNRVIYSFSSDPQKRPKSTSPGLISWELLQNKIPWGRILVCGAGISMASAQFKSGLATAAAEHLLFMRGFHRLLNLFIITIFGIIMTEFCSNFITCGVFAPLIIELGVLMNVHPVYIGLPFALSCSIGFLSSRASSNIKKITDVVELPLMDLIASGLLPKLFTWFVIVATFENYGRFWFTDKNTLPINFNGTNVTCYCEPCHFKHAIKKYGW